AIYPREGTLVADHPYVVLRAPWVDDTKRRAAALFLAYLEHPDRQARLQELGFRDHEGRAGAMLASDPSFRAEGPAGNVIRPPSSEALAAVQASWKDVRKRARVLMVLDVSGSMIGAKLDLMKRASIDALDLFADDDDVGVWIFSSGHQELMPIAPLGPEKDLLRTRLAGLSVSGGTALYTTTLDAPPALAIVTALLVCFVRGLLEAALAYRRSPRPLPGTPEALWVFRAEAAVAAIRRLRASAGSGAVAYRCSVIAKQAADAVVILRRLAYQSGLVSR